MPRHIVAAILVCTVAVLAEGASFKFVTEFRYPTSYEVTGIQTVGTGGPINPTTGAVVTPRDFETREVGVAMNVEVTVSSGAAGPEVARRENPSRNSPLIIAATTGDIRTVKRALRRGDNPDTHNRFGSTALHGASAGGFEDVVRALLVNEADPNATSGHGATPLIFAARNGHDPVVALLVNAGARIDERDDAGKSALLHAAEHGHSSVIALLARQGADPELGDAAGNTPLMVANRFQHEEVVVLLTRLTGAQ